ncbi:MAG: superoxide dismutase [Bacteroidetes bacterium]|nr:superoxide dismutase [Bacteroidota bacterium]
MKRRLFLKKSILAAGAVTLADSTVWAKGPKEPTLFTLPELGYGYDALDPLIDAQTMEIHHSKHHAAYVSNLNKALIENHKQIGSIEDLCKNISLYNTTIRNNAGGHYNHSFFWKLLKTTDYTEPIGEFAEAITKQFGHISKFSTLVKKTGINHFGSGWVWVIVNSKREIEIGSLPNQDNPLMNIAEQQLKGTPILAIDVWEHAYYLKHQNNRIKYLSEISGAINWEYVNSLYLAAIK